MALEKREDKKRRTGKELVKTIVGMMRSVMYHVVEKVLYDRRGRAQILQQIACMPQSNGSRYYKPFPARVGIVADPFVFENYAPTCQLVYLTPENWRKEMETLDCLLVVSTWHGLNREWDGVSRSGTENSEVLHRLMQQMRKLDRPVLFYSKEDPPNFNCFISYAGEADCVFTSAVESIAQYQQCNPGQRVEKLLFAVNPQLYHPIGSGRSQAQKTVFFAGSWIDKYPERIRRQEDLFRWIQESGWTLKIADRNFELESSRYRYPFRYKKSNLGSFSYGQIAQLNKCYPIVLNLNSVTESETMFSMRVYDALACGAVVISNESKGMEQIFPEIEVIQSRQELKRLLDLPVETMAERRTSGIRCAFRQGTVYERMAHMLYTVGLQPEELHPRRVGVLLEGGEQDRVCYERMFQAQSYPEKVWITSPQDTAALSECTMVAVWGSGYQYGPHYLEDMINAFKYTDCDYITSEVSREGGCPVHEYTQKAVDRCASVFWKDALPIETIVAFPSGSFPLPRGYRIQGEICLAEGKQCSAGDTMKNVGEKTC